MLGIEATFLLQQDSHRPCRRINGYLSARGFCHDFSVHNLRFDDHWDRATGFRTYRMLAGPVVHEGKYLQGALRFIGCANEKPSPLPRAYTFAFANSSTM